MPSALPDGDPPPPDGALPQASLQALGRRPFGIYLHVPFCSVRCGYCDFNTYTLTELGVDGASVATFADAALRELAFAVDVLGEVPPVDTVFVGGGTPTMLR
jgi:coproporphyrinogen III oxidase-like Fe-S oxidoreductase